MQVNSGVAEYGYDSRYFDRAFAVGTSISSLNSAIPDYVLVLLFVKYVSDKYAGQKDSLLDVPEGGSFADMVALKGDKEIGDKMNKIVVKVAIANDLKGTIDIADFNDEAKLGKGKEMTDRLSNLVAILALLNQGMK